MNTISNHQLQKLIQREIDKFNSYPDMYELLRNCAGIFRTYDIDGDINDIEEILRKVNY